MNTFSLKTWADFDTPPARPDTSLSVDEAAQFTSSQYLTRAEYYDQFPHTAVMAKWCRTRALLAARDPAKKN